MCTNKIIKFSVSCCGQCLAMEQALERLNVEFESINLDDAPQYAKTYMLTKVPTLIKLDENGNEIARIEGHTTDSEYKSFLGI